MPKRREFACFDAVEAAVACVCRGTVLLQNLAAGGDATDITRRLQGVAAAAHRGWRELNGRLGRTFLSAMEREDISAFVRELATLCHTLWRVAAQWESVPPDTAARWTAHVAEGGRLLRELCSELPRFRQENELCDRAEKLYALRREADRLWAGDSHTAPLYEACVQMAHIADTAEWLVLKNT